MAYMKDKKGRRLDSFEVAPRELLGNALTGLRPCATRTRLVYARDTGANSQSDGVRTMRTSMTKHFFPDDAHNIRIIYGDSAWWNTNTTNSSITVTASIVVAGQLYQQTFGGRASTVIDPMGYATSDPIAPKIPGGTWIEVRTCVSVASGAKWPVAAVVSSAGGVAEAFFDDTDVTMLASPSWNGSTGIALYGPSAIVGLVPNPTRPSVLLDGDSILQGSGDSAVQIPYDSGWACKAMANQFSYLQGSLHGDSGVNPVPWGRDRGKFGGCTDYVISALGSNDLYVNMRTAAQLQVTLIARWRFYRDKGSRVLATTITPRTSSTDAWATVANQTISNTTVNAHRVEYNNWLRDGAPMTAAFAAAAVGTTTPGTIRIGDTAHPLFDYLDIADLAESARDSGKWAIDSGQPVADGTHPTAAMVNRIATGLNLTAELPKF